MDYKSHYYKIFFTLFFLSGFTSLIYQVLWVRQFSLFFGSDVYSIPIVLGAFMTGLSIGSYLFSLIADRQKKSFFLYGILEILIAVSAFIIWNYFESLNTINQFFYKKFFLDFNFLYNLSRFFIVFIIILIPTILMGGTLPVLIRGFLIKNDQLGSKLSALYYINTIGAVFGVLVSGFFLIQFVGLKNTNFFTIGINIFIAIIAFFYGAKHKNEYLTNEEKDTSLMKTKEKKFLLLSIFITGLAGLGLEVIWTRVLVQSFSGTIYSFSIMLASFLFGIFYGSKKINENIDQNNQSISLLFKLQLWLASSVALLAPLTYVFPNFFGNLLWFLEKINPGEFAFSAIISQFIVSIIIIILPTVFLGASFPLAVKVYSENSKFVSSKTGEVYFFNTLGALLGSLIAGFIIIPNLGTQIGLIFISFLFLISSFFINKVITSKNLFFEDFKFHKFISIFCILFCLIIVLILPRKVVINYNMQKNSNPEILYHKEGIAHTIDIVRSEDKKIIFMVNGNIESDTSYIQKRHFILKSLLPLLLHDQDEIDKTAIVGMGLGITLESLLNNSITRQITLVEISEDVITAHKKKKLLSTNVFENEKLRIIIDDARNFFKNNMAKFDLITADPIHPRISGVGYIYTKEYYELLKNNLNSNGIVLQWMPMYRISEKSFQVALKTFFDTFSNSSLWYVRGHGLLVGKNDNKKFNFSNLKLKFKNSDVIDSFKTININTPHELAGHMLMDRKGIENYLLNSKNQLVNTDDNSYLEFKTPFEFLKNTDEILKSLIKFVNIDIDDSYYNFSNDDKIKFYDNLLIRKNLLFSELKEEIK